MSFMDQGRMIYIKGILPYKKDCEPLIFKEEEENVAVLMCWKIEREDLWGMEAKGEELTPKQQREIEEIIKNN